MRAVIPGGVTGLFFYWLSFMVAISTEDVGEIAKGSAKWVESQAFNNVLLLLILGTIGFFTWYAMTDAVPKHMEAIQAGHLKSAEMHKEAIEKISSAFSDERERQNKIITELIQRK